MKVRAAAAAALHAARVTDFLLGGPRGGLKAVLERLRKSLGMSRAAVARPMQRRSQLQADAVAETNVGIEAMVQRILRQDASVANDRALAQQLQRKEDAVRMASVFQREFPLLPERGAAAARAGGRMQAQVEDNAVLQGLQQERARAVQYQEAAAAAAEQEELALAELDEHNAQHQLFLQQHAQARQQARAQHDQAMRHRAQGQPEAGTEGEQQQAAAAPEAPPAPSDADSDVTELALPERIRGGSSRDKKKDKKDKKDKKGKKKNKAKKSRAPSGEGSADAHSTWSQTKREMSASNRRQVSQAQLGGRDYLFPPPEADGGGQVSRSPVRGGGMGGSSPNRGARSYGRLSERGVRSLSASRPDMQTDALNRVRMLEDTRGRVHELVPRPVHQTQGGDARSVGSARSAHSARTPSVASSAGKSSGRSSKGSARSVSSARTPSVEDRESSSPAG